MSAITFVVQAIVASTISAPAYGYVIPQKAPVRCIVVTTINEQQEQHLSGAKGTFDARVSVACHSATPDDTEALGEEVKAALGNITNQTISGMTGTVWKDGSDVTDFNDARTVFRRIIDFRVRWSQ